MSTVVYKAAQGTWEPTNLVDFFGEENLLTLPLGINPSAGVTWCVVERRKEVRWSDIRTIEEITYELFVCYFDADRRLLYINNSANDGLFEDMAEALVGPDAVRFAGSTVYRVMADIQRLVPTNVGVLDARDQFRRFSMHVGSDVTASFTKAEAGTKTQTNATVGAIRMASTSTSAPPSRVESGPTQQPTISRSGATGAMQSARSCWTTNSHESVIGQFILPEPLTERPTAVLLGLEWPWELHTLGPETVRLDFGSNIQVRCLHGPCPNGPLDHGPFPIRYSHGCLERSVRSRRRRAWAAPIPHCRRNGNHGQARWARHSPLGVAQRQRDDPPARQRSHHRWGPPLHAHVAPGPVRS